MGENIFAAVLGVAVAAIGIWAWWNENHDSKEK